MQLNNPKTLQRFSNAVAGPIPQSWSALSLWDIDLSSNKVSGEHTFDSCQPALCAMSDQPVLYGCPVDCSLGPSGTRPETVAIDL